MQCQVSFLDQTFDGPLGIVWFGDDRPVCLMVACAVLPHPLIYR